MARKLRYQDIRKSWPPREPQDHWVFEPFDAVLLTLAIGAVLLLQGVSLPALI